jgi:hypothetical protein
MYKVTVDLTTATRSERIKSGRPIYEHGRGDEVYACSWRTMPRAAKRTTHPKTYRFPARRNEDAREDQKRRFLLLGESSLCFGGARIKSPTVLEGCCQFSGV